MKKQIRTLLFLSASLLLSSCFHIDVHFSWNAPQNSSTSTGSLDKVEFSTPKTDSSFSKENLNKDVLGYGYGYHYLPSTGNSKILVIPVESSDCSFSSTYGSSWRTMLENAFFGDSSSTGWESVSSYYKKSSYGKLNITGEVSPAIRLDLTTSQLSKNAANYDKNNKTYTDTLLGSIMETISEKTDIDLSEYDSDNDGYIDAIWLVYSMPYSSSSNFFWAYTTWVDSSTTYDSVKACCYSWASMKFLMEEDYRSPLTLEYTNASDCHTFIHETGHMLGLDDYYSYDYSYTKSNPSGNKDTPMGGVDMMDFNIGDHDTFSKYILGWTKPDVLTTEYLEANNYTLSLSSATETGKSFLLPIYKDGVMDYNQTAFDEYLLIEYYTPTSLNSKDISGYGNSRLATYNTSGVLVYHVDARVGKMTASSNSSAKWDGYCYDSLPSPKSSSNWGRTFTYYYIYSNTKSYSWEQDLDESGNYYRGRLISILPRSGTKIQGAYTGYSSVSSLYRSGSSFDSSVYKDFKFDDGSIPNYGFKVKSTTESDCVLEFKEF